MCNAAETLRMRHDRNVVSRSYMPIDHGDLTCTQQVRGNETHVQCH